jgi:hypothetical protein
MITVRKYGKININKSYTSSPLVTCMAVVEKFSVVQITELSAARFIQGRMTRCLMNNLERT